MIWLIASRELRTRANTKAYKIVTGTLLVAAVALALVVGGVFSDGDEAVEFTIGLQGDAVVLADSLTDPTDEFRPTVVTEDVTQKALVTGELDVIYDGVSLVWAESPWRSVNGYLREVLGEQRLRATAEDFGLSDADLGALFSAPAIDEVRLDDSSPDNVETGAAFIAAVTTFILLQTWGSFMVMGVIEEKSSRIVEILLSHVSALRLLTGKVLGLGILAVAQMLIVAGGLALALTLVGDVDVSTRVWTLVPVFVVTFLFSFTFYASAFAAVGSMVSRQEDATQAQVPAMLPLIAAYMIGVTGLENPDNILITIGSFVPFTAPVLLPMRAALVEVPLWQTGLALGILAVSTVIMMRIAGRIYRNSLLSTGGRLSFKTRLARRRRRGVDRIGSPVGSVSAAFLAGANMAFGCRAQRRRGQINRISQVGPGASESRRSAVTSTAPSRSASATYHAS